MGAFLFSLRGLGGFYLGNLGSVLGVDFIGYALILLRFWIIGLVVLASQKVLDTKNFPSTFLIVCVLLLLSLVLTFSSIDLLTFYIFFERSLIPTMVLILGWGYQPERLQAGVYILFYTLFASLPLLVSLLSLYRIGGSVVLGLVLREKGRRFLELV